jgi:hypothetical protein
LVGHAVERVNGAADLIARDAARQMAGVDAL